MSLDRRILACVVLSVVAHVALARAMRGLPRRADAVPSRKISIRVVAPPPAAEPPPEPVKAQPAATAKPVPIERARPRQPTQVARAVAPQETPPPERPAAPSDATGGPVFGVSMESTSQVGGGPSMPIGNPANARDGARGGGREAGNGSGDAPVPAYEVTRMPLPQGRCAGTYTDEAKLAAVEGTVVLDLVVGADGRVSQVHVVSGLAHGLTQAAIAAARACRFSPGEKGDQPVAVRIREFKIRFVLQNDE